MTSRMALGSVSTLALGAMLIGAMPYLVSRTAGASSSSPWGGLAGLKAEGLASVAAESETADMRRAQLLKLASLKAESAAPPASAALVASAAVVANDPSVVPVEAVSASNDPPRVIPPSDANDTLPKDLPIDGTTLTGTAVEMRAVTPSDVDINNASISPTRGIPAPPQAPRPANAQTGAVNINTASTELLDRFPGVGRIGHAIVTHRPYRDVSDLVRKRVLRMSDYQKIQSRIRVD